MTRRVDCLSPRPRISVLLLRVVLVACWLLSQGYSFVPHAPVAMLRRAFTPYTRCCALPRTKAEYHARICAGLHFENDHATSSFPTRTHIGSSRLFSAAASLSSDSEPLFTASQIPQNIDPPKERSSEESDIFEGLKSKPVPGGNWDPKNPLGWAKDFGGRSPENAERLKPLIHLKPGDEGYFDSSKITSPKVTIVRTKEQAARVMEVLMNADPKIFHACDTEVMDIDLKVVGPVGNGYVTCASIYSGPDFDYGLGDGPGTRLWIDNLDDACGILQEFKAWFEDPRFLKIWHHYGFDRHVMWNEGIDCQGFAGDTMHMARLQDTSRDKFGPNKGGKGYSLEALTSELLSFTKRPMKELFGVPRLRKDGTPGSIIDIPPVEVLQRDPRFRSNFIKYSCDDAEGTWMLHEVLVEKLKSKLWVTTGSDMYDYYWNNMREFGHVLTDMERRGIRVDAKDYLASVETQARKDREGHLQAFRRWAAEMIGPDGLALNPASSMQLSTFLFGGSNNLKTGEPTESEKVFKVARDEVPPEALEAYQALEESKRAKSGAPAEPEPDHLDKMTAVQLKALCREQGLKVTGKKAVLQERLREHFMANAPAQPQDEFDSMSDADLVQSLVVRGLESNGDRSEMIARLRSDIEYIRELECAVPEGQDQFMTVSLLLEEAAKNNSTMSDILSEVKAKPKESKWVDVKISSVGMKPSQHTSSGAPSVTAAVIKSLAGNPFADPPKYGSAYKYFATHEEGHKACVALHSLCAIGSIDTMIGTFLTGLQSLADHQSRVHCALNLNTETGRLSSRRPNLQNQPALEKDTYKIRQAFQSSKGNNLIVADYGQLELRLLASITDCKSMIEAFEAGGDFHSRTAMDMFDYIKKNVDSGDVLLEWDYANGSPPKPLVKDEYASERRKAKTLNFSIAYGKTAHGLSQDWGVSREEAQDMVDKWYAARPEVLKWQQDTKAIANSVGETVTLMGRYRQIRDAQSANRGLRSRGERASINTPIQGGAADVAMMAMNKINRNEKLKRLGWILLMQIHDEVILEGPEETAEEAFEAVLDCMQSPWVRGLWKTPVPLLVDGSCEHKNWYDAK
eukprot:Nitzschia sp. Nitz4//scaffold76_size158648//152025//155439//NITZ4_002573-RA/size158648-snap-gene-0.316-mRNA-1//-1//CDS//3329557926//646//frame0